MAYLTPKPKASANWMSSQVLYGIDTSDPDPKNWKEFGLVAEQKATAKAKPEPKAEPKP